MRSGWSEAEGAARSEGTKGSGLGERELERAKAVSQYATTDPKYRPVSSSGASEASRAITTTSAKTKKPTA